MLREMGIEPLQIRRRPSSPEACLLLVPLTARGESAQEHLLEQLLATLDLPEDRCVVRWQPATAAGTSLPPHAACLALGENLLPPGQDSAVVLPSLTELLHRPTDKRQVWRVVSRVRRQLLPGM